MFDFKLYFQDIHYSRKKPPFLLDAALFAAEFFYGAFVGLKNFLYDKNILKEKKCEAYIICVGNLTTGGVGKTPIVAYLANENAACSGADSTNTCGSDSAGANSGYGAGGSTGAAPGADKDSWQRAADFSKYAVKGKIAIISRGYGSKIKSNNPVVIKDDCKIYFSDGTLCGDEAYQTALKVSSDTIVITCPDRFKAAQFAISKYNCKTIIMDDGFSNRKLKKDRTILVFDSKMRAGNGHLLPRGPLRECLREAKRADEIIVSDKCDCNIDDSINWARQFGKPIKIAKMAPNKIYNIKTRKSAEENKENKENSAIAFCAIGQPEQFFDFARKFYTLKDCISFPDHYSYSSDTIKNLVKKAKSLNINTFITTQKDEAKIKNFICNSDFDGCTFLALELKTEIVDIKKAKAC